jgi:transposase
VGTVQGIDRKQYHFTCLDEAIEADNPVRVVDAVVDTFDLEKLGFALPKELGRPSYAASDMLKLYLYGYSSGIRSSRMLEAEAKRNIELKWLLKGLCPDHKTIAEFRRKNPKSFQNVFREFVYLLDGSGLLGKEVFAVDGTKIKASNNKKLNFSRKKIKQRIARLNEKIDSFFSDEEGRNTDPEALAASLDLVRRLQARRDEFKARLEKLTETGENEMSVVDPDARLMGNNRNGVDVSYNVQSAVDEKHCLVVEINVTNNPADHGQLSVMGKRIRKRLKIKGKIVVLADKGYYNGLDLYRCKKNKLVALVAKQKAGRDVPDSNYSIDKFTYKEGADYFTCPAGQELFRTGTKAARVYENKEVCKECNDRAKCTTGEYRRLWVSHHQRVLREVDERTTQNPSLYKKRQMMVEHPVGTIKRTMNGHYFLLRTLKKVRGEVALLFLAYNLKRAINILGAGGLRRQLLAFSLMPLSLLAKILAKAVVLRGFTSGNGQLATKM